MACKKSNDNIIFLHKILNGPASGSFGIDVAKLAQLPEEIINRASIILKTLEFHNFTQLNNIQSVNYLSPKATANKTNDANAVILNQIKDIDIDNVSPRQALDLLNEIKEKIQT